MGKRLVGFGHTVHFLFALDGVAGVVGGVHQFAGEALGHGLFTAFETIAGKTGKDANEVFTAALTNVAPQLEVKAHRVGGATYQVPIEIRPERRQTLGLRWLVEFSRKRGEKTMAERLAGELMDAANNTGNAVKRKEEMHRMAEANKAFAHYRW